jgi:beta-lactamase class A
MALLGVVFVCAGIWVGVTFAGDVSLPVSAALPWAAPATPSAPPAVARPGFGALQQTVIRLFADAGASGGVTVSELGGPSPQTWSYDGDQTFVAASTYKLPLLMMEAQNVAAGRWRGIDSLCYQDGDWEDGYYTDYQDDTCMSRAQLDQRVGQSSDNTAAHILIRYDGGSSALNAYARSHGAQESAFFVPNTTSTSDLARLWVNEAQGRAGGRTAQQYLYPMLTHTAYEEGIPAGLGRRATAVHKVGILDAEVNDAALVLGGPRGSYVLSVCTSGPGGDPGWKLIADISRAVWAFEASR